MSLGQWEYDAGTETKHFCWLILSLRNPDKSVLFPLQQSTFTHGYNGLFMLRTVAQNGLVITERQQVT